MIGSRAVSPCGLLLVGGVLQGAAGCELDGLRGGDLDGLPSGRVAAFAGGTIADREREETRDADLLATTRGALERGLEGAQYGVDRLLLQVGGVGDRSHQFLAVHEVSFCSLVLVLGPVWPHGMKSP